MRSPIHPEVSLELREIEPGLSAYACPKSGGVWIPLERYHAWKEFHQHRQVPLPSGYQPTPADDSKQRVLICPESGRLLMRYRVGHGLNFHVDLSPITGGVWLDKDEWDALKSQELHGELNYIFTASYQRQIRNDSYEQTLQKTFAERIGPDDFQKVEAFKSWLATHPQQRDICCYLMHGIERTEN
jgi:Zn-finger nucleic acid-binding protein